MRSSKSLPAARLLTFIDLHLLTIPGQTNPRLGHASDAMLVFYVQRRFMTSNRRRAQTEHQRHPPYVLLSLPLTLPPTFSHCPSPQMRTTRHLPSNIASTSSSFQSLASPSFSGSVSIAKFDIFAFAQHGECIGGITHGPEARQCSSLPQGMGMRILRGMTMG